jgi:hypothetical protein
MFSIISFLQGIFLYFRSDVIIHEIFSISNSAIIPVTIILQNFGLVSVGIGILLFLLKNESFMIGKKVMIGFCFIIGLPLLNIPVLILQGFNISFSPIIIINFISLSLALSLTFYKS